MSLKLLEGVMLICHRAHTKLILSLACAFFGTTAVGGQTNSIDAALLAKAQAGDAASERQVGSAYANGEGVPQDFAKAAIWYRRAAEQGFADAQNELGVMCRNGQGVQKDYAQAATWFRKAADQGNVFAQVNLGNLYQDYEIGLGDAQNETDRRKAITADDVQAVYWFRKAAEQGDADAQFNLGVSYGNGQGVPQDYAEEFRLFRNAADLGNAVAQHDLGVMYENGEHNVPKDYAQAAAWYRKSADQGFADGQVNLGLMYENGRGVPQDYAEAYFWLDLAASGKLIFNKPEDVAKYRDDAASHLTNVVLLQTQERARQWFEAHLAKTVPQ